VAVAVLLPMACFDNFFIILLGGSPRRQLHCEKRPSSLCGPLFYGFFVLHSVEMKSLFPFVTIINNFRLASGREESLWPPITPHTQIIIISKMTMMIESRSLWHSGILAFCLRGQQKLFYVWKLLVCHSPWFCFWP